MALLSLISTTPLTTTIPAALAIALLSLLAHRIFLHPLSHIPGPLSCRLSSLWTYYHSYIGDEATLITALHTQYASPVIRVAPNEVVIADGACLAPIYSDKGGFAKAECYRNFNIDGFASLFSELDKDVRAPKAKSVLPLFSTGNLRQGEKVLGGVVDTFVQRLGEERDKGGRDVNVLNMSRGLALDAVTAYLFGTSYGGLEEKGARKAGAVDAPLMHMSASEFVDAFVGVGRFFYLPNWIFVALELVSERLFGTEETERSMAKVDDFVKGVVGAADPDDGSYPGRMLKAGLSVEEIVAQCKDLMFAGTDSSGMNLSTLCWQLAKNKDVYQTLKAELATTTSDDPSSTTEDHPYLRACINESLRLSLANPTRLPRVVPPTGWSFTCPSNRQTYHFPPGTLVSAQIQTLHSNPAVFPDPDVFRPERWLDGAGDGRGESERLAVMKRDFIPFGLGSRQCIARNLAMTELTLAGRAVVRAGVLDGAEAVGERVEIIEWFNSRVKGEEILLRWAKA